MDLVNVPKTYGALLIGAFFASLLYGVSTVQSIVYFKLYPNDSNSSKLLVRFSSPIISPFAYVPPGYTSVVRPASALDTVHTALIWVGMWSYLIDSFGDRSKIDTIPFYYALRIFLCGLQTSVFPLTHYFDSCVPTVSKRNYWMTMPVLVLAICRLFFLWAVATTGEMIRIGSFTVFKTQFRWLFSLGLALSSAVDIEITLSLFILLWRSRSDSLSLTNVIDSLILYTFELGSLTCFATVISMICWLTMHNNLVFLGLHFVIGKLYANSLLASLNTRHELRRAHANSVGVHAHNAVPSSSPSMSGNRRRSGIRGFQIESFVSNLLDINSQQLTHNTSAETHLFRRF
ncbi:hypothetical protein AMATHDRAFT_151308 [Amanita thiersii Skay4041]|uniref:DUF6534 domain-containing protein n=1 Tax=Amanita thiersii Skay4041 TaxID=703135 RepID=A0A2A9NJA3_9AGAR|nr:hypothetical protein AMATHDRAFT_151308 [Amanita thiersii Skay4041]